MASGPIEINMALNTSAVAKGAQDAQKSFSELEDAVDDIGKSGSKVDNLERAIDGVKDETRDAADEMDDYANVLTMSVREGERKLDALERAMRKVQDETNDTTRATKRLGDDGARDLDRLGEAGEEIGSELRQNLGETFSSFRGDLEDLPQIAQDTLGGLAGSGAIGGIAGLAATAAGAAGLGLVIGAFDDIKEKQQEAAEEARKWAQATIDAGSDVLESAQIIANSREIMLDPEKLKEAQEFAENVGVSESSAIRAMAGDQTALAIATESLRKAVDEKARSIQTDGQTMEGARVEAYLLDDALSAGQRTVDNLTGAYKQASEARARDSQNLLDYTATVQGATSQVDELGNAVITLPDGTEIFIDAKTGEATDNLNGVKGELVDLEGGVQLTVDAETGEAHVNLEALDRAADATNAKRPVVEADADTADANAKLDELNNRQLNDKSATVRVNVDTSAWDNLSLVQKYGLVSASPVPASIAKPFDG